jgi:hypothetical protein
MDDSMTESIGPLRIESIEPWLTRGHCTSTQGAGAQSLGFGNSSQWGNFPQGFLPFMRKIGFIQPN